MAELQTHRTVAELVTERPSRSRFFEKLGIDYCCGGERTVDEVCEERGLDARTLLDALEASETGAGEESDLREATPAALIHHIVEIHHGYLRRELPRLSEIGAHVAAHHGEREPRLRKVVELFERLRGDLEKHIDSEESELFPALLAAEDEAKKGAASASVADYEEEHRATGRQLAELRSLTEGYRVPEWGCNSFRAFYAALEELEAETHRHVHEENNLLFPAAGAATG